MNNRWVVELVFVLLVAIVSSSALCAVLRVEQDGTGDFFVIQDAVDVAASGDTIMIGPGRYNDGEILSTPGWTEFVRVVVRQNELTLIGDSPESTVIGPDTVYEYSQGGHRGIESGPYWGNQIIRVQDIGFENMAYGIVGAPAPSGFVENCRFSMNNLSVWYVAGGDLQLTNCSIGSPAIGGASVSANAIDSVKIQNCSFEIPLDTIYSKTAIHLQSVPVGLVSGCSFVDGNIGVYLSGMPAVSIDNCVFTGQSRDNGQESAAIIVGGSNLELTNTLMQDQYRGLLLTDGSILEMFDSQIVNVVESSIGTGWVISITVHNSLLAHGSQYAIWQIFPCELKNNLPHFDLTNNDWGTTEADSIEAWISTCEYVIDYVPFVGMPVTVDRSSMGSVKALFH